jgi:hypothetical protein
VTRSAFVLALGIFGAGAISIAIGYRLGRDHYARPCFCEHARAAHEHDRPGLDCSLCLCNRYARARV